LGNQGTQSAPAHALAWYLLIALDVQFIFIALDSDMEALLAACDNSDLDSVKRILPRDLPEDQRIAMKQHNEVCRPALIPTSTDSNRLTGRCVAQGCRKGPWRDLRVSHRRDGSRRAQSDG